MAGRNWVMAATVVGTLVLGACGSDEQGGDAPDATVADVTVPDEAATSATDTGSGGATDDTAAGSTDTLAVDDGSSADGGGDVVGDPALYALTQLSVDDVCALLPKDQVEAIVGGAVADPSGMQISSLGANCLYTDATTFDLVAKLEFNVLPWTAVVGLAEYAADGVPEAQDCTIGGRPALCTPEYELNGISTGAQVYVQLGGDDDISLFTESSKGLDLATQLAELAFANLHV